MATELWYNKIFGLGEEEGANQTFRTQGGVLEAINKKQRRYWSEVETFINYDNTEMIFNNGGFIHSGGHDPC